MEQFVFFRNYYVASKMLDENQRHEFIDAIFKYMFEDDYPDPKSSIMPLFTLIEPTLSKSKRASDSKRSKSKSE